MSLPRIVAIPCTVAVLAIALSASGCGNEQSQAGAPPPPPVNVVIPLQREVQEHDDFTGRLAAIESLEVRSRVPGYIQSIGFKDGDDVKKGQVLFQIDPRPYEAELNQAKAALGQAQAESEYANRELARIEPLASTGGASALELSKAQDMVDRAKASIAKADAEIARRQLDLNYASVKSPIDGRISKSAFTTGNLVGGDTLLTTVVSVSPIHVNFDVDERRMLVYREIARKKGTRSPTRVREANIPLYVAMANEGDFPHQGVVDFVDNQVDVLTGTIRARGELDNSSNFFTPGQFVRVRLRRDTPQQSLLVPDRAVGRDQDRKYLLVVNDKNIVEYRAVQTGGLFNEDRAIMQGLNAGERVVVDGLQRARPGQPVTPTLLAPSTQPTASAR